MDEAVLKNALASLGIMWRGMLGLFVVCGGIAVIMIIIARFTRGKGRKE